MLCLKPDELKQGMKLARPIYNKQGVLLYDRNTKLTTQSVQSINNFGLFGVFILEPTEPAPDITEEEREFERFQTMSMFALKDEMENVIQKKGVKNIENLSAKIIKMYGKLNHKVTINKSLRSADDYVYKHSVNVAILCAVISAAMGMSHTEQMNIVIAALLHETSTFLMPKQLVDKEEELTAEDRKQIQKFKIQGNDLLQQDENISSTVKVIIGQSLREVPEKTPSERKLLEGTKVLRVADVFDTMTQLGREKEPFSQVAVVKYLLSELEFYGESEVAGLIKGINILNPGVCVELSNKARALVIKENERNILRPVLLGLDDNTIYDLGNDRLYNVLQIQDILKTMDRRVSLSPNFLEQFNTKEQG